MSIQSLRYSYLLKKLGLKRSDSVEIAIKHLEDAFLTPSCILSVRGGVDRADGTILSQDIMCEIPDVNSIPAADRSLHDRFEVKLYSDNYNRLNIGIAMHYAESTIEDPNLDCFYKSMIAGALLREGFTAIDDKSDLFAKRVLSDHGSTSHGVIMIDFRASNPLLLLRQHPFFEVGVSTVQYPCTDAHIPVMRIDPHDFLVDIEQICSDLTKHVEGKRLIHFFDGVLTGETTYKEDK